MTKEINTANRMRYAETIIEYTKRGYQKTFESEKRTVMTKGKNRAMVIITMQK